MQVDVGHRRTGLRQVGAVALGAGVAVSLLAQTFPVSAQQDRPQFRGRTDVVRLDVSVLDGDRRPVRGLTAGDFTIIDNGREYSVLALSEIDLPAPPPAAEASWTREVAPDVETNALEDGRLFVIVLDDALMPAIAAHLVRQSKEAAASIIERMGPTDLAAVVFTSDARRSQNFTRNRDQLLAAVDRLGSGFFGAPLDLPAEAGGADVAFADEQLMRSSISTLKQVAETLIDGPERRKALVYIGRGIPLDYSVVTTQIGPGASGFLEGAIFHDVLEAEMGKIFEGAQRANVAVYAIDPTGLDVEADNLRRDYLETLASNTGGIAVTDTNDFMPGVTQIYEENSAYYLLGYEPADPPRPGAFRAIDVRVNRPGLTVRARHGYYGPESDEDEGAAVAPVTEAITGLLPESDMPMRVHVAPVPIPDADGGSLIITAELRQPAPDERVVQEVELIASAYDNDGKHAATRAQTARLVLRPSLDEARYEVLSSLELEPGRYNIRFAGYNDALGLSGSVFYDVEVPELDDRAVALSAILFSVDPRPPFAPPDALDGLVPVIPTTQREFIAYQRTSAFVRLSQGRRRDLTPVTVTTTILDASGRTVSEATTTIDADAFRADRLADFEFTLPLLDLGPGPHLLVVTAVGGPGDEPVTRRVPFSVR